MEQLIIRLVKVINNAPTVKISVKPSVSKFNGEIVWTIYSDNGDGLRRVCTLSDNQLLEFAYKIITNINLKKSLETILGTQELANRINQYYISKQSVNQSVQPVQQQPVAYQPVNPTIINQSAQPVVQQPAQSQPVQTQPVNPPITQPINHTVNQPVQQVQPVRKTNDLPDIETI